MKANRPILALLLIVAPLLAAGCVSTKSSLPEDRDRAVDASRNKDVYGHPLPADKRNLAIKFGNSSILFTVPPGWLIVQQPDPNNAVYVLSRDQTDQRCTLSVSGGNLSPFGIKELLTTHSDQAKLHEEYLKGTRRDFPGAGIASQEMVQVAATGRSVLVQHYVGNDGQQLLALIPETGFRTAIALHGQNASDIEECRHAFQALLQSYRIK